MIGDCEQFIEIEDIQKVHQHHIDNKPEVTTGLNKRENRLVVLENIFMSALDFRI